MAGIPGSDSSRDYLPAPDQGREELLKQVIQATASRLPVDRQESNLFARISRRHADREWCLDPVAIEIVGVALAGFFAGTPLMAGVRSDLTREVAEALYNDPQAGPRLQAWWQELRGV